MDRQVIEKDFNEAVRKGDLAEQTKYQLFWQMTHITAERGSLGHDDRLDALAMLVGYFVNAMNQDVDRQVMARKQRELDKELRVFMSQGRHLSQMMGQAVVLNPQGNETSVLGRKAGGDRSWQNVRR